jgi:CRISPR-associated endonuclease/helicase Cas3
VQHLLATHHGQGRPHFTAEQIIDPDHRIVECEPIAIEVPRRFARLQRKFGRWGLAYIESLLRAADYAASAEPSKFYEEAGQ